MNRKVLTLLAAVVIVMSVSTFTIVQANLQRPPAKKTYTLEIIHKDGTIREMDLSSKAKTLAEALNELDMVSVQSSRWGTLILEADGVAFNDENDGGVWKILVEEKPAHKTADEIPLEQNGYYTLVYSTYLEKMEQQDESLE